MAELVQSHAAPDLLLFDSVNMDPEGTSPGAMMQQVARIGSVSVPVFTPHPGVRDNWTLSTVDLRKLLKEAYRLGWQGKCIHVRSLLDKIPAEIAT